MTRRTHPAVPDVPTPPPPPDGTPPKPPPRVAPLAPLLLAVVAGVAIDRAAGSWGTTPAWASVAAAAGAAGLALARFSRVSTAALLVAWLAVGGARHHQFWFDLPPDDLARVVGEEPRPAWLRGVLADVDGHRPGASADDEGSTRATLEVSEVHDAGRWRPASGSALLTIAGDRSDLTAGSSVEAAGGLGRVPPPLNPGEFDYREFLRGQGVRLRFAVADPSGVWPASRGAPAGLAVRVLGAVRSWSRSALSRGLDPSAVPLASALLLGRREGVAPEVNDAFARTGTTHLLAISGLHLQVLGAALGLTLRLLGLPRRSTFAAVALATVGYAGLVGLMPSVVRSAVMTVTYCLAGVAFRRARPANTLAAAGLVTLALNPSHLFDVGCQLSFLAVGAIVWGVGPVTGRLFPEPDPLTRVERHFWPPWKRRLLRLGRLGVEGLTVSAVVWLAALPLVALRFHLVSPVGVLLNVPLVPLTSLALLAAGASLGLSALGLPAGPASWACANLLALTESVVAWGAAGRWGYAFVPGPSAGLVLGFYGLAVLSAVAYRFQRQGRGGLAVVTAALSAALLLETFGHPPWGSGRGPEAEVLAVGHGLAVVLDPGDGRAVLYDCGRMRDPSVGRRVVAPALWARGVRGLDAVFVSHADSDHYGGLPDIFDRFAVGALFVPPRFCEDQGAAGLLRLARERGVPVREAVAGERWEAGAFRLRALHPPAGWRPPGDSDNARSLVLDVGTADGGGRLLLTGDLDGPGLEELTRELPAGPAAVMLAPHHGGRSANPRWLYERVGPETVVVSQRPPPDPSRDPVAPPPRRVFRTWEAGAVRLSWSGRRVVPRGYRDRGRGGPPRG